MALKMASTGPSPDMVALLTWPSTDRVMEAVGHHAGAGFDPQRLDHDGVVAAHDAVIDQGGDVLVEDMLLACRPGP